MTRKIEKSYSLNVKKSVFRRVKTLLRQISIAPAVVNREHQRLDVCVLHQIQRCFRIFTETGSPWTVSHASAVDLCCADGAAAESAFGVEGKMRLIMAAIAPSPVTLQAVPKLSIAM